jgi:hypothetical protein
MSVALPLLVRLGTSWPTGGPGRVLLPPVRFDLVDGGAHRVAGSVLVDAAPDVPVSRRVRLYHAKTGRLVREQWSDAAGAYAFEQIAAGSYFVVAHDHTLEYNSVIRDRIDSVPMP